MGFFESWFGRRKDPQAPETAPQEEVSQPSTVGDTEEERRFLREKSPEAEAGEAEAEAKRAAGAQEQAERERSMLAAAEARRNAMSAADVPSTPDEDTEEVA